MLGAGAAALAAGTLAAGTLVACANGAVRGLDKTARSLDIVVRNGGLLERILSQQATAKKRSIDDLRREYGVAAVVAIPVMLGNSPAAKALGQAVARFVAAAFLAVPLAVAFFAAAFLPKRPFASGAASRIALHSSSVSDAGSRSFGILPFLLPSVM